MEEIWKDIKGYEGLYRVSNLGNIYSLRKNRNLVPTKQRVVRNYYRYIVTLTDINGIRKTARVHRLVAQAFISNPNNYNVINHKDGNTFNNKIDNLEWCTQRENVIHARKTGLNVRPIDKVTKKYLIEKLNNKYTFDEIADELGVAKATVFNYIKKFKIKKYIEYR